jgi:hypothetical protein
VIGIGGLNYNPDDALLKSGNNRQVERCKRKDMPVIAHQAPREVGCG